MGKEVTVLGDNERTGKRELKKHAATIHCSNALTLLQRKISNALLFHAYPELMAKVEHEITVKQLCRLIGYQGNNHAAIREALKGLISTVIEWNLIDETGAENWTASSIIASVSLEGPLCYYAYSPRMKQLLHSPSMFGKIDLVIQSKFRSSYGLALYENCIRYRGLPQTKWLSIDLFKKLMGIPADKYNIFRDFKRRVLDKAVDEVNMYSDLTIIPELFKEGRKVTKIRFILKERAKKNRLGEKPIQSLPASMATYALNRQLSEQFGLSSEQTSLLLTEYDQDFIQSKIKLIEDSKPYQAGKIKNLGAYLLSALKNNYQVKEASQENVKKIVKDTLVQDLMDIKPMIDAARLAYRTYREETIQVMIDALAPDTKSQFYDSFYQFAEPIIHTILQLQRHKYTRDTVLQSPQLQALLRRYAIRELDIFSIASLEEFVAAQPETTRYAWQKLKSYDPDHELLRFNE